MIFSDDISLFISFMMIVMSIIGTVPILQCILKARSQESGGYAENILARAVSRRSQLSGYFRIALAASVLMPFLNAVGLWAGSYFSMEQAVAFSTILQAGMAYVPAIWVMLGISMLLIAYLPRFVSFAWAYLGYAFVVLYFGSMMRLPGWLLKLSPYGHIPMLPMEDFSAGTMAVMVVLSAVMCVLGFVGYRKREMVFSH